MSQIGTVIQFIGIPLLIIFLLYLLYLTFLHIIIKKKLKVRFDKNPLLKYFTAEDFPDLYKESFSFKTKNDVTINGFIYKNDRVKDYKKVLVFFHGMGPGHLAYTKEIHRLVNDNDLALLAFDYLGTNLSEGKSIVDIGRPLVEADYFIRFITQDERFKNSELILVGHSWGGYVAGNLLSVNGRAKVSKIIIWNGLPDTVTLALRYAPEKLFSKVYFRLLNIFALGKYANKRTGKTLKKYKVPTLITHGELDKVILRKSINSIIKYAKKVSHISVLIYKEHHHFTYLSPNAEKGLHVMQKTLEVLSKDTDKSKIVDYARTINYDRIGEHNDDLFRQVKAFIKGN